MNKVGPYVIGFLVLAELVCRPKFTDPGRRPAPELSPLNVVQIQVDALQHFNEPTPNAGIWTTFQFASPANRRVTGPYGHFLQLIKDSANRPFLQARTARYSSERRNGSFAEVTVELEDQKEIKSRFRFSLSLQGSGLFKGCWMTDGVSPL